MSANPAAESYSLSSTTLGQGLELVAPMDYTAWLLNGTSAGPELLEFIAQVQRGHYQAPLRREILVKGFPILLAYMPQERKIYAASRRLSRELTLLGALESEGLSHPELKAHAQRVGVLDPNTFPSEWHWVTSKENLADWSKSENWTAVEEHTQAKLAELVRHVQAYRPTLFERVSDWGLGLTASYALIRIHLLKFLALLPSLDHDKKGFEVKRNLIESLRRLQEDDARLRKKGLRQDRARPLPRSYALALEGALYVVRFLPAGLLASLVRAMVKKMAKRFIAGESIASSDETLLSLHASKREATLDQLGELVVSEEEADEYLKRVLAIIHGLKVHVQPGEKNAAGINKAHVSIKVSALASDFKPHAFDFTYNLVAPRLRQILVEARREQVFINIDAEHYHYRDFVLRIFRRVLLETPELAGWGETGIVLQAYLRDGAAHLRDIIALARERGVRMPIRLVKGAYWDAETIEAEAHSHHAPQFLNKEESDLHFRQLAAMSLAHPQEIQLAVGSHNLQDHCFVEALRELHYPQAPVIEHQCLHMTYEALSHGLAGMGWPTRNYMPIGNLLVGMAYLVRRIMENSSQVGILTIMRSHNKKEAFQTPWMSHQEKKAQGSLVRDSLEATSSSEFKNCTPRRLYVASELNEFTEALKATGAHIRESQGQFKNAAGAKVPCSSHPELIVGVVQEVSGAEAQAIAKSAYEGMQNGNGWSEAPLAVRTGVLLKAADRMWQRRDQLSALIVYEAGKTWSEALADVDEAIDFINFYVREELRLGAGRAHARGVTAVIAPWNFPLAIPCGMAVAPLVAGNAVILKPAEQTPLIARQLVELLWECGVPKAALFFTPGDGLAVGAPLVKDPHVACIVFTGSKAVGQWIYQTASSMTVKHPKTGVSLPKKVITEMGGKNAIIVTNNCEQDETVSGILYSAFGHAGQKCSACSRVLVDSEVKESLLKRLVKAIEDLEVGKATEGQVLVNPLITAQDQERVRAAVKEAVKEARELGGKVWVDRSQEDTGSFAVGPVLIELPASRARQNDSWAQREVFGPVLHIVSYDTLDEAIELFNSTEYGLTGGIYGQSQDDIDYLSARLLCGNLYVNRPNTGARVAIEPFGGFKLSGTGPKAGGADYLAQFHVQWGQNDESTVSEWSAGSGFKFELPHQSGLGGSARLSRWHKLAELTLARYEALTGTVSESEKRVLKNYIQWIHAHGAQTLQEGRPHLRIPGQLSFGLRDTPRESLLMVIARPKPQLISLMHWLSALAAGTGVAVACTTQESYSQWKGLCDSAWQAGFSHQNLEVYLAGKTELEEMLAQPGLAAQYISAPAQWRDEVLTRSLPPGTLNSHMRAIYHDGEHPSFESPAEWLEQYVYVRAFAVNTMRHGAPLELGL